MNRIVVLGGGAAGMMAAIRAAECGAMVHLIEPNDKLGKKLNITGKGRCNVTNDTDLDGLMQNIPCNGRFLYSAFSKWLSNDTMAFFEAQGVPLKVERGNRVFPVSDSAFDITDALKKRMRHLKVEWIHDQAMKILTADGAVYAVQGEKETYPCDAAILATGGVSYPLTGSTGDGYRMARELGHTIIEPKGSLVPLVSPDEDCAAMQGLSLKNVELTAYNKKNKAVYREFGEMLFTHFGVSGPLVLSLSAHLRNWDKENYRLEIDLKPALDEQKLEARILRDISENPNKGMDKIIGGLVHRSMVDVVLSKLSIAAEQKANALTKEQRRALIDLLKHFPVAVSGTRPVTEAIVTTGGVKVGEVQPSTMESKRLSGLYLAGELLDVDAYTGGFNLQIAWATGHQAGRSAAEK